ncbi:MAG: hypothetical protein K6E45_05670 [Bacteroidaceae bacterium]|nr:hypothetical protein [Bacteroidaceae bacterium]
MIDKELIHQAAEDIDIFEADLTAEYEHLCPPRPRILRLWPLAVAACVAGIIAFLLWPKENTPLPTSPIVAGKGHPQERPKAETKTQLPQAVPEQEVIAATHKPQRTVSKPQTVPDEPQPVIPTDEPQPIAIAEPVILEELSQSGEPPIPTDRQALVNIYLAETALKIAYQLQDQVEVLRVFSASLEGKETQQAKPIIAF